MSVPAPKPQTLLPAQNRNASRPVPQLSLASIGAVYWVNHNRDAARSSQVDSLEFYEDPTATRTLLERTDLTERQLDEYAAKALSIGVNVKSATKMFPFAIQDPSRVAEVFRNLPSTWALLEGTIPHDPLAVYTRRLTHFFPASIHTCAPDCIYSLAIICNVWLIQRDQITPRRRALLLPPARTLYDMCTQKRLPERTSDEHKLFRNSLASSLNQHDAKLFGKGNYMELMYVFEAVFEHTPQFTWHSVKAVICCDGVPQIFQQQGNVVASCYLDTGTPDGDLTLGEFVTKKFCSQRKMQKRIRCTTPAKQCTGDIYSIRVVLDCLPARLTVRGVDVFQAQNKTWGLGDDLQFQYYNNQMKLTTAKYAPESCVLYPNKNHYVLRHRRISTAGTWELLEWDHLHNDTVRVYPGTNWYEGKPKASIYMVVYRLVE